MKRSLVYMILAVIMSLMLTGCANQPTATDKNADEKIEQKAGLNEDGNNEEADSEGTNNKGTSDENTVNEGTENEDTDNNSSTTPNDSIAPENVKTGTGRYIGQIDNNSIEIKISGIPDATAARAFRLTDEIAAEFNKLELQKDDQIIFEYYVNEFEQNVLVKIQRQ